MKARSLAVALSLLALAALPALAQDKPKDAPRHGQRRDGGHDEGGDSGRARRRSWPALVGDWTFTNKMWMAPGAAADGVDRHDARGGPDGRPLRRAHLEGQHDGHALRGAGTEAYDNVGKQYVSSWVDNMGTGIMHATGTCDAAVQGLHLHRRDVGPDDRQEDHDEVGHHLDGRQHTSRTRCTGRARTARKRR